MNCEVCGDSFEPVQVRKEEKESDERYITYYKCKLCGCGRIDYPPFMPKNDNGDETDGE